MIGNGKSIRCTHKKIGCHPQAQGWIHSQRKNLGCVTKVCQLLEVSWQMCHAWIAHWTVTRATLTMSRRRTHGRRTHARSERARTPFGAHVSPFGASSTCIQIMTGATSARIKEPSMASDLHIKSSVPNTYQSYYI